jgi:hypothetical protein
MASPGALARLDFETSSRASLDLARGGSLVSVDEERAALLPALTIGNWLGCGASGSTA